MDIQELIDLGGGLIEVALAYNVVAGSLSEGRQPPKDLARGDQGWELNQVLHALDLAASVIETRREGCQTSFPQDGVATNAAQRRGARGP